MLAIISFIWKVLSTSLKVNLVVKTLAAIITSFLDIIALIIFAQLLSSLVQNDSSHLFKIASFFGFNTVALKLESVYLFVICLIILLVLVKSVLILTVNRKILKTLAGQYEIYSKKLAKEFFKMQTTHIKSQPSYEIFLAINSGIRDIFITGASASINIVTEVIIVSTIVLILIIHGGLSSLVLAAYFLLAFYLINKFCGTSSKLNSKALTESNLSAAVTIQAIVESIREIRVFNSLNFFLSNHEASVKKSSDAHVDLQYVVFIPKIILESTFVAGIAMFTWFKIDSGEITTAVVEIGFLVAMGSRIIPSLLRLQFSLHQIKQVVGSSIYSLKLLTSSPYKNIVLMQNQSNQLTTCETPLNPEILVDNLSFSYPESHSAAISQLSLAIRAGESIGIAGRTGSGKSTLIDLLLGAIEPTSGSIKISGVNPVVFYKKWQGAIGFVPQSIALIDGSIRDNILLGRSSKDYTAADFRCALEFAGISDFVDSRNGGLDSLITRAASELSGGQRQKLGIARAMLSKPSILILDEVTSSLDSESESVVNSAISNLHGQLTLIVVAHRLTTLKSLDRILLLEKGTVVAEGKFSELLVSSPTFKSFAELHEL